MKAHDIISAAQFTREQIESLFARADAMSQGEPPRMLEGKTLAALFYEPSTHTRASFERAMQTLGGVFDLRADTNPALEQTIARIDADALVLRHPVAGAANIAADAAAMPVINAGDGTGEHPTEALAQLHALRAEKQTIDGLRIALVGDLKNGRAAHSLAILLAQFDVRVSLVAPAAMSLPYDLSDGMRARGLSVEETNDLPRVLEQVNAVILACVESKHWTDTKQFEKMSGFYKLEHIAAQVRAGTWLAGTWSDGAKILADAYRKVGASAVAVRMGLLMQVLAD